MRMIIEENNMKVALPLFQAMEESFDAIDSMKKLEASSKIKFRVTEALKQQRVAFNQKDFRSSVISYKIYPSCPKTTVPSKTGQHIKGSLRSGH